MIRFNKKKTIFIKQIIKDQSIINKVPNVFLKKINYICFHFEFLLVIAKQNHANFLYVYDN